MRVLFVSEEFPYPLDTGGNVRTFHLLRALASEHEVVLLCMDRPGLQQGHIDTVKRLVHEVRLVRAESKGLFHEVCSLARSLANGVPFVIERHRSRLMQAEFDALVDGATFDAIHFNHLDAVLYLNDRPGPVVRVLDQHNVVTNQAKTTLTSETRALRRLVLRFDLPRLARFETELCNQMQTCFVCSDDDAACLGRMGVEAPSVVVPNGVDLDFFQMSKTLATGPRLVFFGTLDYDPCEKGVWYFCNEIFPKIRARLPTATFTAIGRNPSKRLLSLAAPGNGIEFTGRVEDLRPHVHKAGVFVAPLLSGSGTRLKILEAMAMGVPVVSTTIGAEGIAGIDGDHFRIADTAEDFARAVMELVEDPQLARRMRDRARQLVERSYSWPEACRRLLAAYSSADESKVAANV